MMIGSLDRARAAARLETGRLCDAGRRQQADDRNHVHIDQALKTPQFYLIWLVLFLQRDGRHRHSRPGLGDDPGELQGHITAVAAAGFVGLLSLFNMGGRFSWASPSDLDRPQEHLLHLLRARRRAVLLVPGLSPASGHIALFVLAYCVILTHVRRRLLHRAGILSPTCSARRSVGGIHGVLLTAWAAAGVAGPVLVNYIRAYNVAQGVPKADAYTMTVHIMTVLLVVGFVCNLLRQGRRQAPHEIRPECRD